MRGHRGSLELLTLDAKEHGAAQSSLHHEENDQNTSEKQVSHSRGLLFSLRSIPPNRQNQQNECQTEPKPLMPQYELGRQRVANPLFPPPTRKGGQWSNSCRIGQHPPRSGVQ